LKKTDKTGKSGSDGIDQTCGFKKETWAFDPGVCKERIVQLQSPRNNRPKKSWMIQG